MKIISSSHPVIVTPEVFNLVQHELRREKMPKATKPVAVVFLVKLFAVSVIAILVVRYGTPAKNGLEGRVGISVVSLMQNRKPVNFKG